MVAEQKQCFEHSGMAVDVRELRGELRGMRRKVDRIEKLLWGLVATIGAGAAGVVTSGDAAAKVLSLLVGVP